MSRTLNAAMAIARRDFVATVWSRTFLLFLLAPIVALGFGLLIGNLTGKADVEAQQPTIAVISDGDSVDALRASHDRITASLGRLALPDLDFVDPEADTARQARRLLDSSGSDVSAVFVGDLAGGELIGPPKTTARLAKELALLLDDARARGALGEARIALEPAALQTVDTAQSAGSLNLIRYGLARGGQMLIFILTLILAGMLLSNLVEEKSNKVIEVLAAAVPLDAIFFGKLIGMLGVSLVGIFIWGLLAAAMLLFNQSAISVPVTPAVGWPLYCLLVLLYFTTNYMVLGALFLGIGGQASNVREVQTLSMPITFAQVMLFALASMVVGDNGGTATWIAALFPFSSPMAMMAVAAQSRSLWPHLAALAWQLLWVALIIRVAAAMFRRNVLKSGPRRWRKRGAQPTP